MGCGQKEEKQVKLTGAKIIMECLKEQGVDTVFGSRGARRFLYTMRCTTARG
jgi:hypothetical protein